MSVIIRRLASPTMEIFVKGAPEVMKDICTPESSTHFTFNCFLLELMGACFTSA